MKNRAYVLISAVTASGLFLAGAGFGYRQAFVIPALQKARQNELQACLAHSKKAATDRWARRCSDAERSRPQKHADCIREAKLIPDSFSRNLDLQQCEIAARPTIQPGTCRLPIATADRLDRLIHQSHQDCLDEANAHL